MAHRCSRLAAALGGVVMSLTVTTGIASAQPDLTPLINTTCSYSQIMAALNEQAPELAKELSAYPMAQARLQKFLAMPVGQRQTTAQQALANPQLQSILAQKAATPEGQQGGQLFLQMANTCNNY